MKTPTLLIAMFFGFLSTSLIAQEITWFDINWQITTKDKGEYYRPKPKKVENGYWLTDYYKSGQKQMEGFSTIDSPFKEEFDGLVTYYHPNGNIFHQVNYKNGKLDGFRKIYYESGELKEEGQYTESKREGVWKTYYKNGKIESRGKYRDGEKVGIWKTFYKNVY
ncbi:MORN repeat protein [Tenacibaculum adriaticum]|uniref:MORN repeat protein n=1 Tax=Tenacibaculum adriaticum TaxID=413713 RepID=A0A5S5DZK3_9FLAO|nr:hypothetical protein [Tenacibaculum adriaticum]TYQ00447.1 MORN repeat protein [Tenacibaculum adriaticum]